MDSIRKHIDLTFLGVVALAGVLLGFYATSKYGAGLPSDSMRYISVSENLLNGQGFIDYDQMRLIWFPPLLPLLIAGLSYLLNADVFLVGWHLNIFLWGLNLFLIGLFLRKVFRNTPVYFYIALLIIFLSPSSLFMHTSILTEPLFLTFSLLFFFVSSQYLEKRNSSALYWMILLAIGASLLRWAGMSHIVVGGLIVLLAWRSNLKTGFLLSALFSFVSFLPVAVWIYFHNYLPTGTLWGSSSKGNVFVVENILQALRKIFYWFVPYRPISPEGKLEPVIFLVVMLLVFLILNRKQHWQAWGREFLRPLVLVATLFASLSFVATALMTQTYDHRALGSDRYYALLLAPILVVLFLTFDHLLRPHLRISSAKIHAGLILLFLFWSALPVVRLTKYLQISLKEGEAAYNLHNIRIYHESEIIAQAQSILAQEPQAVFYSNIPAPVWFFTRKPLTSMIPKNRNWSKDDFKESMAGWPYDKPGYVIWFENDPYKVFYPPLDLYLIADIHPVYEASDGTIYYVSARNQP